MEDSLPSQNKTLQRVNLCEFLKMRMNLEKEKLEEEKSKLEAIKCNLEVCETAEGLGDPGLHPFQHLVGRKVGPVPFPRDLTVPWCLSTET